MEKMTKQIVFAAAITLLLLCHANAEGVSDQLKTSRQMFDDSLASIDDNHLELVEQCRDAYATSLKTAEITATKKGDLDAVVLIRAEKARFNTDRAIDDEIKPGTHPAIKTAIGNYLKGIEFAEATRSRKLGALGRQYVKHLQGLKKKLTVAQNIDDALKVRQAILDASADPILKEALSYQPPTTRGRTCVKCSGTGVSTQPCQSCSDGPGICSYCKGAGKRAGLGASEVLCFVCTGTGKCKKCKGAAVALLKCKACNGAGITLR
jgi:hypothetical protein